jgi:hypothetical protein
MRLAPIALATLVCAACISRPPAGQFGTFRYAGKVMGAVPLRLLPPIADIKGNVYVLNGAIDFLTTYAFVGHVGGGWSSGCDFTKGDNFGAHGWAGFATDRAWYWSGDALVAVPGIANQNCHRVLDHDPGTDANLLFRGVLPWVREQSERTSLVALVQSPVDLVPFSALVDLNAEILTNVQQIDPADAADMTILGVGGDRDQQVGVALLKYTAQDKSVNVEGRFYDGDGNPTASATVPFKGGALGAYSVQGYLQLASNGLVAGLLSTGDPATANSIVIFDRSGGTVQPVSGMTPAGMQKWEGNLWLVGDSGGQPMVAPIDSTGAVGAATVWGASEAAAAALAGDLTLRDDRSLPSRTVTWTNVKTAIGNFPFESAHALTQQAPGTTLWLVAGPSYEAGSTTITSFAMAPVGVSYP